MLGGHQHRDVVAASREAIGVGENRAHPARDADVRREERDPHVTPSHLWGEGRVGGRLRAGLAPPSPCPLPPGREREIQNPSPLWGGGGVGGRLRAGPAPPSPRPLPLGREREIQNPSPLWGEGGVRGESARGWPHPHPALSLPGGRGRSRISLPSGERVG